jgi:hypothetical protein
MLELSVFLCGAVVMVIELTGSRVLAPYLGTSLVVWTSLIGIILASLFIGYWWGGRLAGRRPEARLLGGIILTSAFATALVVLINLLSAFEGDRGRFFRALFATYAGIFPKVMAFDVDNPQDPSGWQNLIIVAFSSEAWSPSPNPDGDIASMLANRIQTSIVQDLPPLTVEFAPVDRYVASAW